MSSRAHSCPPATVLPPECLDTDSQAMQEEVEGGIRDPATGWVDYSHQDSPQRKYVLEQAKNYAFGEQEWHEWIEDRREFRVKRGDSQSSIDEWEKGWRAIAHHENWYSELNSFATAAALHASACLPAFAPHDACILVAGGDGRWRRAV